jgi:pyridoxamine 5'-phosphate oxidase
MTLHRLRRDYAGKPLDERRVPADPLALFQRWLAAAIREGIHEPNGMTLSTVDARGRPRARMLLLKQADARGFTFYTNQASAKGRELAAHPEAALVFWWQPLHRSVRVEGRVRHVGAREADAYFAQRPRGAQLGAWTSQQSRVIASREALERAHARTVARFAHQDVPRPPHWGGYRLTARTIEFWQGRPDRLHDRLRYTRGRGGWKIERLAP